MMLLGRGGSKFVLVSLQTFFFPSIIAFLGFCYSHPHFVRLFLVAACVLLCIGGTW